MPDSLEQLSSSHLPSGDKCPINIQIVYRDLRMGKQARKVFNEFSTRLRRHCDFTQDLWSMEILSMPMILEAVSRAAAGSEMIMVATYVSDTFSRETRQWIQSWIHERRKASGALVGLFHGSEKDAGNPTSSLMILREMAQAEHVDYFEKVTPPRPA